MILKRCPGSVGRKHYSKRISEKCLLKNKITSRHTVIIRNWKNIIFLNCYEMGNMVNNKSKYFTVENRKKIKRPMIWSDFIRFIFIIIYFMSPCYFFNVISLYYYSEFIIKLGRNIGVSFIEDNNNKTESTNLTRMKE